MAEARPLFVYGTLRHPALLGAVLGRLVAPEMLVAAVAPEHRAAIYPGRIYPGLAIAAGREATGLLLTGLTPFDMEVLDAFEGEEYGRRPISVLVNGTAIEAEVYWPAGGIDASAPDWNFEDWRTNHGAAMIVNDGASAGVLRQRLLARGAADNG